MTLSELRAYALRRLNTPSGMVTIRATVLLALLDRIESLPEGDDDA